MTTASLHLASSRPDRARATTPRGACTAAEGLDAETFRGFPLAGDLFLLTSFFIERISVDVLHVRSGLGKQKWCTVNAEGFSRQECLTSPNVWAILRVTDDPTGGAGPISGNVACGRQRPAMTVSCQAGRTDAALFCFTDAGNSISESPLSPC